MADRHIVAIGGYDEEDAPLGDFVLGLARRERPRICFVPTATAERDAAIVAFYERFASKGDTSVLRLFGVPRAGLHEFLLEQDVVLVAGGNTANMLAVWRVHGVDTVLREAWERGTVLAGWSAGAICWFEAGVTDSFAPELAPLEGCLGLLEGSFCPHYDSEAGRAGAFHRLISAGLPDGYAADDGVGLHFSGTKLGEIVGARPGARAFRVERGEAGVSETPLPVRHLG
jgi:dipeptidase E